VPPPKTFKSTQSPLAPFGSERAPGDRRDSRAIPVASNPARKGGTLAELMEAETTEWNRPGPKNVPSIRDARQQLVDESRAAALAKLKAKPYYSNKRPNVNLNGNFTIPEAQRIQDPLDRDGEIVCRHLASWYLDAAHDAAAQGSDGRRGKVDFTQVASQDAAASNVKVGRYLELRKAPNRKIVDNAAFGAHLSEQFAVLEAGKQRHGTMFIQTTNHDLAVDIEIKSRPGQADQYVVRCYDPNLTQTHKRVSVSDPKLLPQFTLTDFLGEQKCNEIYDAAAIIAVSEDIPRMSDVVSQERTACTPELLRTRLHLALAHNFPAEIEAIGRDLKTLKSSPRKIAEVLAGTQLDGVPAISLAMQNGHPEAIGAWGKLVAGSGLRDAQLAKLLAGKRRDGVPAVNLAMQEGQAGAIEAWGKLVADSGLRDTPLAELLTGKDQAGSPAVYLAMQNGHAKAIEAWGELVTGSGFRDTPLAELLAGKRRDGVPAMNLAMQNGHEGAIEAWGELVAGSGLRDTPLAELLAGKRPDGVPAIGIGIKNSHSQAVRSYSEIVNHLTGRMHRSARATLLSAIYSGQKSRNMIGLLRNNGKYTSMMRSNKDLHRIVRAMKAELKRKE